MEECKARENRSHGNGQIEGHGAIRVWKQRRDRDMEMGKLIDMEMEEWGAGSHGNGQ